MTEVDWKDRLVYTLNRPWLTALLLAIGILGLYWELSAPGIGLPGLIALLSFGVFFWSHFLGGTAGWLEVLLFALGITCLMMEIFVLPGFGVFGVSGIALIAIGLVMATQDFLVPETPMQWQELRTNSLSVLAAFLVLGVLVAVQILVFDTIPGLSRFQLRPEELVASEEPREARQLPMVVKGDLGVAESDLRPSGKTLIGDQLVDVLTEGDYVERGSSVVVIRVEGNIVTVRKVNNS
jgi:membrane-bound serine protease (ClpP class)